MSNNFIQKQADDYIGYPHEVDEGITTIISRKSFYNGYEKALNDVVCALNMKNGTDIDEEDLIELITFSR